MIFHVDLFWWIILKGEKLWIEVFADLSLFFQCSSDCHVEIHAFLWLRIVIVTSSFGIVKRNFRLIEISAGFLHPDRGSIFLLP